MSASSSGHLVSRTPDRTWRLGPPGFILGVGVGGLVDGIVFHQILQWHQLVSEEDGFRGVSTDELRAHLFVDGLFHAVMLTVAAVGGAMLWRSRHRTAWSGAGRALVGWILVGWGTFNVTEGVVNHHILRSHRVRPTAEHPLLWDVGFLVVGTAIAGLGWWLRRPVPSGPHGVRGHPSREAGGPTATPNGGGPTSPTSTAGD